MQLFKHYRNKTSIICELNPIDSNSLLTQTNMIMTKISIDRKKDQGAQCMLGNVDMRIVNTEKEESTVHHLFTYCSPASWPQSQSEVSVESAEALGEEEEQ